MLTCLPGWRQAAHGEAESIKLQDALIREEEEAERLDYQRQAARLAIERERKARKKVSATQPIRSQAKEFAGPFTHCCKNMAAVWPLEITMPENVRRQGFAPEQVLGEGVDDRVLGAMSTFSAATGAAASKKRGRGSPGGGEEEGGRGSSAGSSGSCCTAEVCHPKHD